MMPSELTFASVCVSLQQEVLSAPFTHQTVRRAHGLRSAARSTLFTQPPTALSPQVSVQRVCVWISREFSILLISVWNGLQNVSTFICSVVCMCVCGALGQQYLSCSCLENPGSVVWFPVQNFVELTHSTENTFCWQPQSRSRKKSSKPS